MRVERVAGQAFAQRLDDRNGAADRRLEIERHAMFFGERGKLARRACASNALLAVTTDLPAGQRGLDRSLGRIAGAADQLDENVDVGVRVRARPDRKTIAAFLRSKPRFFALDRAQTATTSMRRPQRTSSVSRWRAIW